MHGKSTHMDAGERFKDDNIIEFHEPRVLPKLLGTSTGSVEVHPARAKAQLQSPSLIRKQSHPVYNEPAHKRNLLNTLLSLTQQDAALSDNLKTNDEIFSSKRPKLAVTSSRKINFKIATILGNKADTTTTDEKDFIG